MKRLIFVRNALFFCLTGALLTGCTAPQAASDFAPAMDESFEAQADMEYGEGQTAQLHITRCSANLWEAAFAEPATLAGVVLTFDGDAVTASYKGLEFTVPKSALPAKNMLSLVTDALDAAAVADQLPCVEQEDGTWCYASDCAGGAFTLTFTESGEPLVFELPAQPLKITFSSYNCLGTAESAPDEASSTTVAATEPVPSETTENPDACDSAEPDENTENNEGTSE